MAADSIASAQAEMSTLTTFMAELTGKKTEALELAEFAQNMKDEGIVSNPYCRFTLTQLQATPPPSSTHVPSLPLRFPSPRSHVPYPPLPASSLPLRASRLPPSASCLPPLTPLSPPPPPFRAPRPLPPPLPLR